MDNFMNIESAIESIKSKLSSVYGDNVPKSILQNLKFQIDMDRDSRDSVEHKKQTIRTRYGELEVDCGIAELIECLMKVDIRVTISSESNVPKDYMWLVFQCQDDVERFMEIVFRNMSANDEMYCRATIDERYEKGAWHFDTFFNDIYRDKDEEYLEGASMNISVRFPKSDYSKILKRVKKYMNFFD